jgi:hypothetical protein
MTNRPKPSSRFKWPIIIAAFLALILLSLGIPGVRASLSAWLGLSVAPSNQMPATAVTLIPVTLPAPTGVTPAAKASPTLPQTNAASETPAQTVASSEIPAELSQLATQVGWDILTPSFLPEGYQYQSAYYAINEKMLVLTYLANRALPGATDPSLTTHEAITLLEATQNDFIPMQVAPQTNMIDVEVNGQPAAYAVGAWDTEFVNDVNDPNNGKLISTWRNDLQVKNLFWQVGDIYLTLVTADEAVSQQELIAMANSIGQ